MLNDAKKWRSMEGFGILCHPCNGFLDQRVWEVD
jgi:glutathione peroxidase-family protein